MEKEKVEFFTELLNERLEKLLSEAEKTVEDMSDDEETFPDPTDRASLESDRNFLLRIRDRESKLIVKEKAIVEKADKKERELARAFESAQDNLSTAKRELKGTEGALKHSKDLIETLNKRLDKTKGKASKVRTNLEKKTDKLEKAAKDLDVKIPATKEAATILKKLISLL